MAQALITYLQDHLAGAQFAVRLLRDLTKQDVDSATAMLAAKLLPEIEEVVIQTTVTSASIVRRLKRNQRRRCLEFSSIPPHAQLSSELK
jgi:hypothetical protein